MGQRFTQPTHDASITPIRIGCSKHRRPLDEGIGSRLRHAGNVVHFDAAIDLKPDWIATCSPMRIDSGPN